MKLLSLTVWQWDALSLLVLAVIAVVAVVSYRRNRNVEHPLGILISDLKARFKARKNP